MRWVGIALVLVIAVALVSAWNRQRVAEPGTGETAMRGDPAKASAASNEARFTSHPRERPGRDREARPGDAAPDLQLSRRAAEADFRSADADGDGYLSRNEVEQRFPFAAREFERVDGDGDGRVSPQEFWQMRRAQIDGRAGK